MEKDYSSSARPYWPCLLVGVEQANALNVDTTTATSSPISSGNLSKMRHEQRVYEHRAFSSDILRVISKEKKYLTGFKRVGQWIDVGDGWVCWRLNTGNTLLLEPVTFVFHEKIKEMGAKLNIRSSPSASSEILETVDSDAIFKAVAIKDDWLQINLTQTMKTYRKSKIAQVEGHSTDIVDGGVEQNGDAGVGQFKISNSNDCNDDDIEHDVIDAWVLMRTPDFELLVEKKFKFNWLVEDAAWDDEVDSLSDKSSPSRSPSFDLRSSPASTYNEIDERPLPTTRKKSKTSQEDGVASKNMPLNSSPSIQSTPVNQVEGRVDSASNSSTSPSASPQTFLSIANSKMSSKVSPSPPEKADVKHIEDDINAQLDNMFGKSTLQNTLNIAELSSSGFNIFSTTNWVA